MDPDVPPGYKKMDIGIIPEDWKVKKLGEVFEIVAGGDLDKTKFSRIKTSKYKYPIYSNSLEDNGLYGYSTDYKYPENTITVTARGTLGYAVPRYEKFNAIIRLLVLIPKKKLDVKFVAEYINNMVNFSIESTGVPQLTAPQISTYEVSLPPLPEQRAIARVLSNVDKLIESLDKLIEKKKMIKKGAMQELLTGRRRLPGFTGEWVRKRLGEIGFCQSGNGFPLRFQNLKTGEYPFFKVADLSGIGNSRYLRFPHHWITEDIRRKIGAFVFPKYTIVFAKIGAAVFLERKRLLFLDGCIDNNMMGFIVNPLKGDYRFIYYVFNSLTLSKLVESTALPSISKKDVENLEIYIPPTLKEQRAIAQILSDMDAEIEALERKKKKYEMLKKGMMERLLTGKIRLKDKINEVLK